MCNCYPGYFRATLLAPTEVSVENRNSCAISSSFALFSLPFCLFLSLSLLEWMYVVPLEILRSSTQSTREISLPLLLAKTRHDHPDDALSLSLSSFSCHNFCNWSHHMHTRCIDLVVFFMALSSVFFCNFLVVIIVVISCYFCYLVRLSSIEHAPE